MLMYRCSHFKIDLFISETSRVTKYDCGVKFYQKQIRFYVIIDSTSRHFVFISRNCVSS